MSSISGPSWLCQRNFLLALACYCCLLALANSLWARSETIDDIDALNEKICGLSKPPTNRGSNRRGIGPRISSGWNAARGEFPWNVLVNTLFKPNEAENEIFRLACGGSIIHHNLILTAAHCVKWDNVEPDSGDVFIGIIHGNELLEAEPVEVERFCIPPRFKFVKDETSFGDQGGLDLALLRLRTSIRYDDAVRPICLRHPNNPEPPSYKDRCIFSGFGDLDDKVYTKIRSRSLQGLSMKPCPRNVSQEIGKGKDEICMVAADSKHHAGNPCKGDSGGGLACLDSERNDGRYYLAGAFSNWPGVCRPGEATPAFFASTWKLREEFLELYDRCAN